MDRPSPFRRFYRTKTEKFTCLNQTHNIESGLGTLQQILSATSPLKETGVAQSV